MKYNFINNYHRGLVKLEKRPFLNFFFQFMLFYVTFKTVISTYQTVSVGVYTFYNISLMVVGFLPLILYFLLSTVWKCKHDYKIIASYYGDEVSDNYGYRSKWLCKKCGRHTLSYNTHTLDTD